MHATGVNPEDEFKPPKLAILEVTGTEPSPATTSRWRIDGIAGPDGERIRLEFWCVGRKPYTTRNAVRKFLDAVTAARMARILRNLESAESVSDDELRAAGLLGRKDGGAE